MSDREDKSVVTIKEHGIILRCNNQELADQFDDFLVTSLDEEISIKFEDKSTLFFFGKKHSAADVENLYAKFIKELSLGKHP